MANSILRRKGTLWSFNSLEKNIYKLMCLTLQISSFSDSVAMTAIKFQDFSTAKGKSGE